MPYLIDSDWVIDHLDEVSEATELLASLEHDTSYISVVTYMEVFQGTLRAEDPKSAFEKLRKFVVLVPVLQLTEAIAERCGRLREDLRMQGKKTNRRAYDLIIAATALENELTLVTRNVRDYRDISALNLYQPNASET